MSQSQRTGSARSVGKRRIMKTYNVGNKVINARSPAVARSLLGDARSGLKELPFDPTVSRNGQPLKKPPAAKPPAAKPPAPGNTGGGGGGGSTAT